MQVGVVSMLSGSEKSVISSNFERPGTSLRFYSSSFYGEVFLYSDEAARSEFCSGSAISFEGSSLSIVW